MPASRFLRHRLTFALSVDAAAQWRLPSSRTMCGARRGGERLKQLGFLSVTFATAASLSNQGRAGTGEARPNMLAVGEGWRGIGTDSSGRGWSENSGGRVAI